MGQVGRFPRLSSVPLKVSNLKDELIRSQLTNPTETEYNDERVLVLQRF